MKAALAAAAAATVAIAVLLARRRHLRAKKIAYINTEDAPKWHDQLEVFAAALQLAMVSRRAAAQAAGLLLAAVGGRRSASCSSIDRSLYP